MRRLSAIGALLCVAACARSVDLRLATAGAIGCPADEVQMAYDRSSSGIGTHAETWNATCRGRAFVCSEVSIAGTREVSSQVSCAPELPRASVERVRSSDGRSWRLRATFPSAPLALTLVATPESDRTRVGVLVAVPADMPYDCRTGTVVDGTVTPWSLTREQRPTAPYAGMVDIAQLRAWTSATRVAGRVCDVEWRLTPESKAIIVDFLGRFDDAAAWQSGGTPQ